MPLSLFEVGAKLKDPEEKEMKLGKAAPLLSVAASVWESAESASSTEGSV